MRTLGSADDIKADIVFVGKFFGDLNRLFHTGGGCVITVGKKEKHGFSGKLC